MNDEVIGEYFNFEIETRILFSEKQANNLFCFCVAYKVVNDDVCEIKVIVAEKEVLGKMGVSFFTIEISQNIKIIFARFKCLTLNELQQAIDRTIHNVKNKNQFMVNKISALEPPIFSCCVGYTFFSFYNKKEKKAFLDKLLNKKQCLEPLLCSLFSVKK